MYVDPEFLGRVDNAIRFDLESWRVMFSHWLIGSAVLVAIGVGLEGPEVIHEVRNIWRNPKPNVRDWIRLIGLAGWILVIVGVLGEGVFEVAFSISDGQVQTFDEILLTAAQRGASDAAKNAMLAQDSAGAANTSAGDANNKADAATASAAHIGELENKLNADVASADLILSASASGHFFLPSVFNSLSKSPGKVSVTWLLGTRPSSILFAQKLSIALQSMGWHISAPPHVYDGSTLKSPEGVTIYNRSWRSELLPYSTDPHRPTEWNPDLSFNDDAIAATHKDLTWGEVHSLVRLYFSLNANLDVDPSLPANSVVVVVGDAQQ